MFEAGWLKNDAEIAAERVAMGFPTPREYKMEAMLQFLRDHDGECLGDHPDWIAKIDALLKRPACAPYPNPKSEAERVENIRSAIFDEQ